MRELRHDPFQRRWVIIATDRGRRPSDFEYGTVQPEPASPHCPFCPGNEEKTPVPIFTYGGNGSSSGAGWQVRVVPNKFPALRVEGDLERQGHGPYDRIAGIGAHEVIVETPNHFEDMTVMPVGHLELVLRTYRARLADLMNDERLRYILIFKNHGPTAGASLAHPHSQIMATPVTPRTLAGELYACREHYRIKDRCLFCDVIAHELAEHSRIVALDERFVTWCPYASRFPFELTLAPRFHAHDFATISDDDVRLLAHHLKDVLRRVGLGLRNPAYNFLLHTAPNTQRQRGRADKWQTLQADWHWHFEILPRLTKVAGFEWGTGFYINPTAPEDAAAHLREVDPNRQDS